MQEDFPDPLPRLRRDATLFDLKVDAMRRLFRERNNVYHSRFRDEGLGAILSWLRTKQQRIASILTDTPAGEDEGLAENFLDVAVYGVLGAILAEESGETSPCSHLFAVDTGEAGQCVLCGATARIETPTAD